MAIRLLNADTHELISEHEYTVTHLGEGQLITGFREGIMMSGIIHTHARKFPEDTTHIVVVHKDKPVRVTLTTISPDEIIAEGY